MAAETTANPANPTSSIRLLPHRSLSLPAGRSSAAKDSV